LIDSMLVSWTLTAMFGVAALMLFMPNVGARPPTTVSDRLSRGIHVAGGITMIIMSWPSAMDIPVWPQEAGFTLAAGWFFARAVHGPLDRAKPAGVRWRDLHHAAMAGAVTWSITVMTDPQPMSEHRAASMPAVAANPRDLFTAGLLAMYFIVATGPWLSTVVRAARTRGNLESRSRRHAVEAASHATMSIGMAVMFLAMA
jgi:Domain of unknown function (DUF5134)